MFCCGLTKRAWSRRMRSALRDAQAFRKHLSLKENPNHVTLPSYIRYLSLRSNLLSLEDLSIQLSQLFPGSWRTLWAWWLVQESPTIPRVSYIGRKITPAPTAQRNSNGNSVSSLTLGRNSALITTTRRSYCISIVLTSTSVAEVGLRGDRVNSNRESRGGPCPCPLEFQTSFPPIRQHRLPRQTP